MIIDVSHNNGTINWEQVKPHISSAIIRVGYGNNDSKQDDRQFLQNLSECRRLGIPYDFYIYSYAKNTGEAKSEADHVLRLVGNDKKIVYFDSEQPGTEMVAKQCACIFRDTLKSAGFKVGIYASESWYNNFLSGLTGFDSIWIAKYGLNRGEPGNKPDIDCNLWQYTSRALVPGISGYVDANKLLKPIEAPFVPPDIITGGVYRLYNPNAGKHFYTLSATERDKLIKSGWTYESTGWIAPNKGETVFRLYNPNAGDHVYTVSKTERDRLIKQGLEYEGRAFSSGGDTPVYRLYNANDGDHVYTISVSEKNTLVYKGWNYEGIAFYGK